MIQMDDGGVKSTAYSVAGKRKPRNDAVRRDRGRILDPLLDCVAVAQRIMRDDPRYFTTYYAIDAVNFRPVDTSSAHHRIEAPYLPLIVMEAAGLPLDATFVEQKRFSSAATANI